MAWRISAAHRSSKHHTEPLHNLFSLSSRTGFKRSLKFPRGPTVQPIMSIHPTLLTGKRPLRRRRVMAPVAAGMASSQCGPEDDQLRQMLIAVNSSVALPKLPLLHPTQCTERMWSPASLASQGSDPPPGWLACSIFHGWRVISAPRSLAKISRTLGPRPGLGISRAGRLKSGPRRRGANAEMEPSST
jgi:hypothetical protein